MQHENTAAIQRTDYQGVYQGSQHELSVFGSLRLFNMSVTAFADLGSAFLRTID